MSKTLSITDATREWVREFNAVSTAMISELMRYDPQKWHNVTKPTAGDEVYINGSCEALEGGSVLHFTKEHRGTITKVLSDEKLCVELEECGVKVSQNNVLLLDSGLITPMWGTMWSFYDPLDDDWLIKDVNLQAMSNCGFRIFEHKEYGFFFGIDGAGYDFYEAHWVPLYKARGLCWHTE